MQVLPNMAGCHGVEEVVATVHMAREVFGTPWIKLEMIGSQDTLQPHVFALVEVAKVLADDGFQVFPYTADDLIVAEKLLEIGCLPMLWGVPIEGAARTTRSPCAACVRVPGGSR